jgi:xanthine dehydrogenase YagS FAD-binding subunit
MRPFSYTRAHDVGAAIAALSQERTARLIAGGTNLIDLMKEDVERPTRLIDINRMDLKAIENTPDGGLRLGALCTNAQTAYDERVRSRYPLLSKAILAGASPQLRNMATNGGNLLQRTRCYYFYDVATPCNKREPGSGCGALNGVNRIHAILGASEHCIAVHPSDMCVALAALDAVVQVESPRGQRGIPFADFHRLPGDTPHIDNELAGDEIVTAIDLPQQGYPEHYAYIKLRDRTSYAFALVSVAAALDMDGSTIRRARIALGGVAHKPWRVPDAEALLEGSPADPENFRKAAQAYVHGARGRGGNTFKIELATRAIQRALVQAVTMDTRDDPQLHRTTTEPR